RREGARLCYRLIATVDNFCLVPNRAMGRLRTALAIAASRTRPWLALGWGCLDRRLSRGPESLDRLFAPLLPPQPQQAHVPTQDVPMSQLVNSVLRLDDR